MFLRYLKNDFEFCPLCGCITKIQLLKNVSDNNIQSIFDTIFYNDTVTLIAFDIVNIQSNIYTINDTESYIYTKNTKEFTIMKENIKAVNGNISIENNKLKLTYQEKNLEEFTLYYIESTENKR